MKKHIFILTLALFGFLLMPTLIYACNESEQDMTVSCCDHQSGHSNSDDCCENHQSDHKDKGCDSGCSHSGCHCVYCNVVVPALTVDTNPLPVAIKQLTFGSEVFLSSQFLSIWVPPKIS